MATGPSLLQQLHDRLSRLRSVTAFTRRYSVSHAAYALSDEECRWYLDRVLPLVERYVESIKQPEFLELCDRLRSIDNLPELAQEFGVEADFSPKFWMDCCFKMRYEDTLLHAVAALANHFAFASFELHHDQMLWSIGVSYLAAFLGNARHFHDGAGVIEFALGWAPATYRDRGKLRESMQLFAPHPMAYMQAVMSITQELFQAHRISDAEEVLFAALNLPAGDAPDSSRLHAAIQRLITENPFLKDALGTDAPEELVDALSGLELGLYGGVFQVLRHSHPETADELLDRLAGFEPGYGAPKAVVRQLQKRSFGDLSAQTLEILLGQYADCLRLRGLPHDACRVIEMFLGIEPEDYVRERHLTTVFARHRESPRHTYDTGLQIISTFAGSLRQAARADRSVVVIELFLAPHASGDRQAQAILAARTLLQTSSFTDHIVGLIIAWLHSLADLGRNDDAYRVARDVLSDFGWITVTDGVLCGLISNVVLGTIEFLNLVAPRDPALGMHACRKTIAALRVSIADTRVSANDRRKFQEAYSDLRRMIVRLGYEWIESAVDGGDQQDRWIEALAWDAELGQRAILERFLEGGPALRPRAMPKLPPLRSDSSCGRIDDELGNLCLDQTTEAELKSIIPFSQAGTTKRPEVDLLARQLMVGIGSKELAQGISRSEKLLRACFAGDGRLMWGLFESDGNRLKLIVEGIGKPGDRADIGAAARRYDVELELVWLPGKWLERGPKIFSLLSLPLETVRQNIDDGKSAAEDWDGFLEACADRGMPQTIVAGLRESYAGYFAAPNDSLNDSTWRDSRLESLDRLRDLLTWPTDRKTARARRDSPTQALLAAVARIWNLNPLVNLLDPNRSDLLLQVDDVLNIVPIPYLPVGGGLLFEAARSTRCVLSAVLNGWLAEQERRFSASPGPGRGLALSWFKADDRAAIGTSILQRALAEAMHGWEWCAADADVGTHDILAAAAAEPLALAVVFGHGHSHPNGVMLGDGVWGGARHYEDRGAAWHERPGCDLSQIEFLLQVSCSIGRVRDSGDHDIAGFCVDTAVAGGRAVMAGKWPISVVESPLFAGRVASEYRRLRDGRSPDGTGDDACLRARALAAARRYYHAEGNSAVGINTSAAFDLYGLG